jgi:hypothetical protein
MEEEKKEEDRINFFLQDYQDKNSSLYQDIKYG